MTRIDLLGTEPRGKERPRFDGRSRRAHMSDRYTLWKREVAVAAALQWRANGRYGPIGGRGHRLGCRLVITTTTGNMRPDLDNAVGAVWDALVDGGILVDDRGFVALDARVVKGKARGIAVELWEEP